MWYADESGFYFITLSPKAFSKQIKANPKVEICFYNNPAQLTDAKHMRVTGKIEFLTDEETLAKAYKERAFLEQFAGKPLKEYVEAFRITKGEAHFWTLPDVLKESQIERVKF
jgi:uncharacterized pyridoxamine 5'-phosphate oxidase family protein